MKKLLILCLASLFLSIPFLYGQTPTYNNRVLVVGGGGSRGAWGAGFAKRLTDSLGTYRMVYGTSTGSLMAPLIILHDFQNLKTAYTSVTQKSIFNVNPFNEKTGELKPVPAIFRLIIGKQSFGESKNLRKLIDKFVSPAQFEQIRNSRENLSYTVTVVDFKTGKAEYKSSRDIADFEKMKDWMWASGNEPLFMSYYPKKGTQAYKSYPKNQKPAYVDGGVLENVPLKEALRFVIKNKTINNIDVIINKPVNPLIDTTFQKRGILKGLTRLIELWSLEIRNDDTLIPQLVALAVNNMLVNQLTASLGNTAAVPRVSESDDINIHLHYFPPYLFTKLNQKELLFDQERMIEMWNAGEAGKEDKSPKFDINALINPQMAPLLFSKRAAPLKQPKEQPITIPRVLLESFLNTLE